MIYLDLFWSFLQIGLFSVGGGYAALPLIQNQVVDVRAWLTMAEYSDSITIAGMMPGSVAVNAATFVGMQIAGPAGALAATIGCILPACIIVTILGILYYKYKNLSFIRGVLGSLRPAVVALIASAGFGILLLSVFSGHGFSFSTQHIDYIALCLFAAAIFILRKWKPSPVLVMIGCGIVGAVVSLLT